MMEDHRFGRDELPAQYQAGSLKRALSELNLPDSWLSVSLRVTERTLGAALIFKGLDMREGWVVPRVTVIRGTRLASCCSRLPRRGGPTTTSRAADDGNT